jgi:hypothetical protein
MQKLANARPFSHSAAHPREACQQIYVVQQGVAETQSRFSVIFGNLVDDLGEFV